MIILAIPKDKVRCLHDWPRVERVEVTILTRYTVYVYRHFGSCFVYNFCDVWNNKPSHINMWWLMACMRNMLLLSAQQWLVLSITVSCRSIS